MKWKINDDCCYPFQISLNHDEILYRGIGRIKTYYFRFAIAIKILIKKSELKKNPVSFEMSCDDAVDKLGSSLESFVLFAHQKLIQRLLPTHD